MNEAGVGANRQGSASEMQSSRQSCLRGNDARG